MSKYTKAYFLVLAILELLMLTTHFRLAGIFLGSSMLLGIFYAHFSKIDRVFMIAWVVGFAPIVVFIRPFIFAESGFTIITILVVIIAFFSMRKEIEKTLTNKNILFILVFFVLYVAFGLINGAKPIVFLKIVELGTTLVLISTLLYFPEYRSFAFRNFVYSSIAVYIIMFPHIANRFAVPTEAGFSVGGDPSGMAALLVISLIFVFFDNAKMIQFPKKSKVLSLLIIVVFTFLFLSTSRTNMAAMFIILIFYSLKNTANFLKYFIILVVMLILSLSILDSKYINTVEKFYITKLDTSKRSANQLTTNRLVQWQISFHYFDIAPLSEVLFGYGPGKKDFMYEKGKDYIRDKGYVSGADSHYVLHTLYLMLAVEYGLIAFTIFMIFLLRSLYYNMKLYLKKKEILFYFTVAYMFTIMANTGVGVIGGMYMAFIFTGAKIFNDEYLKYDERMKV